MATNVNAILDADAVTRGASVLAKAQLIDPLLVIADIRSSAVQVGLNHVEATWPGGAFPPFTSADYALQAGGATSVVVPVEDSYFARIGALATNLESTAAAVASLACCTGLALLDGTWVRKLGPFTL